ncbi:MAG TPA: isochorismate synthase [Caldithrix abyssi]|uniref:Isochorismate synthase MenF n=1 Tax=Caldithrix abyssi TaxID=187145 RepID=A0A7V4U3F3_CALAY|nr:isochorismate synthase [Caldithrix abyssi]
MADASATPLTEMEISRNEIRKHLQDALNNLAGKQSVVRIEFKVDATDILCWLHNQRSTNRLYWSDRERRFEMAGIGTERIISGKNMSGLNGALLEMKQITRMDKRLRFFGGLRFSEADHRDNSWTDFGFFRFHLPTFELGRREDEYYFACNVKKDDEADINALRNKYLSEFDRLNFAAGGHPAQDFRFISRSDNPDKTGWKANVQKALDYLRANGLKKVVLARNSRLEFRQAPQPEAILDALRVSNPNSFLFLFEGGPNHFFIGSTPERLYYRTGRQLLTEAVAGTRRRGSTPAEDQRLKQDLLTCEKDLREHDYVVQTIEQVLRKFSLDIEKDEQVGILENVRVQHLLVRFKARLQNDVNDTHILPALHPTPAVGGFPTGAALHKISEFEQFDRGWYAGPVGWIGQDEAEFAVAIRSALLQANTINLFSGAGLVDGSDPEAEWQELENKIANYLKILQAE